MEIETQVAAVMQELKDFKEYITNKNKENLDLISA